MFRMLQRASLVFFGIALSLVGRAHAAGDFWIKIGEAANGQYTSYVDTSSVISTGQGTLAAWLRRDYAKPVSDGIFAPNYVADLRRVIFRCAEPSVAVIEQVRLDASEKPVKQDRWPEAQWRFDGLPSGSISHLEARVVCGLGALPSSKVSSSADGDWRQLAPGNNVVGIDHAWVPGSAGYFVVRTRHFLKDVQTFSGKPYTVAINYWVVLCKRPGVGLFAFVNRNAGGEIVESLVVPPESVKLWSPSDTGQHFVEEFAFSTLCKSEAQSAKASPSNSTSTPATSAPAPSRAESSAESSNEEKPKIKTGTGFYVSIDGHILTNSHVVAGCTQIAVRHPDRTSEPAQKLAEDTKNDLALLRVARRPTAVAVFRQTPAAPGEQAMAIGFPLPGTLSSEAVVSSGNVSAAAGLGDDVSLIQITAPVQPGNSGGPLIEKSGLVLGVVVAKLDALKFALRTGDIPQNVNFAIKGEVARLFLDTYGVKYSTSAQGKALDPEAIASRGKNLAVFIVCAE